MSRIILLNRLQQTPTLDRVYASFILKSNSLIRSSVFVVVVDNIVIVFFDQWRTAMDNHMMMEVQGISSFRASVILEWSSQDFAFCSSVLKLIELGLYVQF